MSGAGAVARVGDSSALRIISRLRRYNWLLLGAVFLFVADAGTWLAYFRSGQFAPPGADFTVYRDAAQSWLAGGPFYRPYQLAGPYPVVGYTDLSMDPILYPPTMLALLIPMTAIPLLWWAIPLSILGWVAWRNRTPSRLLLVAALALWPTSTFQVTNGNPTLWLIAFLALATVNPVFSPFLLLKPTLLPFALYRIANRRWWLGLGLVALASLPFASMWADYVKVVLNARDSGGLLNSLSNVPALLIPLVVSHPRPPQRPRPAARPPAGVGRCRSSRSSSRMRRSSRP